MAKTPNRQQATDDDIPENFFEAADEVDDDNDTDGILKTNIKPMTFYHCMIGGYGPSGPVPGIGRVTIIYSHFSPKSA